MAAIEENQIARSGQVLNIGAGGEISNTLERAGINFVSIDVDPSRRPTLLMDAQDMRAFEDERFDAVFLMEVLEHIPRTMQAVAEIVRVLKPGGVLIGSTPFVFGLHDHPHDYYRFTRFGIRFLFQDLECIEVRERNHYFDAVYVLCLRVLNIGDSRQKLRATCLFPLVLAMRPCLWLLGRMIHTRDATTGYFFVFRKPHQAIPKPNQHTSWNGSS